ncbi:MAG: AbrB/MazE/SpoVT family DNA-binding domain-containing protein [Dehalococcoidia bacterium]
MTSTASAIKVGPQGRVVIPAELRRAMDLRTGDTLMAYLDDGRLVLETPEQIWDRLEDLFKHVPSDVSLVDELIRERREEAERESRE